jgi:hypothetical protein
LVYVSLPGRRLAGNPSQSEIEGELDLPNQEGGRPVKEKARNIFITILVALAAALSLLIVLSKALAFG